MNNLITRKMYPNQLTKNFDASSLGYCFPDGRINFSTQANAIKYAKNRVMQALNCQQPFERGIVIKDSMILSEIDGTYRSVDTDNKINILNTIFVHGHPQNTPISQPDSKVLLLSNAKEIIAYNQNGEYSSLQKNISPNPLQSKFKNFLTSCKNLVNCTNAEVDYLSSFKELKNKTGFDKRMNKLKENIKATFSEKSNQQYLNSYEKTLENYENTGKEEFQSLPEQIQNLVVELIKLDKEEIELSKDYTNNFWKNNAHKYNLNYNTNYSDKYITNKKGR